MPLDRASPVIALQEMWSCNSLVHGGHDVRSMPLRNCVGREVIICSGNDALAYIL